MARQTMSQLSLQDGGDRSGARAEGRDGGGALVAAVTPSGRIEILPGVEGDGPSLAAAAQEGIIEAFGSGRGQGVLHLGAATLGMDLHPTLGYFRELGQRVVERFCGALDPSESEGTSGHEETNVQGGSSILGELKASGALPCPEPEPGELEALAEAAPPMTGAELITPSLLGELWVATGEALEGEGERHPGGIQGYLKTQSPAWNVVGRVCLHLAENRRDTERPFAFLATYVHRLSARAKPQHLPLGKALTEYAGAKNRKKLFALLSPLSRAAQGSAFLRELVDSGDVYHPMAWTAQQAHRLLCEAALCERAGLVLRLPDWWHRRAPPRPRVTVTVGGKAPSVLGLDALLDFDVQLTLDGESLSPGEIRALLGASEGLVLIKGRWVEVDRDKLNAVLAEWSAVQAQAKAGGIGFSEAMRLMAGLPPGKYREEDDEHRALEEARPDWSEVVAGQWLAARLDGLRSSELSAGIEANAGLRAELRPYQRIGVQWLMTLRGLGLGGCLADDMGLGKTIQVLGALLLQRGLGEKGTDLLVVPASLLDNWRQEVERFAPALRLLIAHPSRIPSAELRQLPAKTVDAHDAVITTYGTLARTEWMREREWRTVVLDEAQAIKNPGARQTRAAKETHARWRLALTGTPVENRLGDLWSIFDFLNPGLLGSAKSFTTLCKTMAARPQGYAPLRRLVQPYLLRRLKTDKRVIADLPDKTEVNAYCLLSKRQAALYQQAVSELGAALERLDGMERRGVVLAFLLRFKQICNHPSQWLGDGHWAPQDSGKLARLEELCEPIVARQDKVLVFTQFREMTEPLATYLANRFGRSGLVLHGGTPVKKRPELVRRFQEDERVPFMVLSLKAGGTGLNLTAASHVIHFDRWWNPAVENQATDRAFRIGQKKNVLVHKFICRGTVEEHIDELMKSKQGLSDEVLSGGLERSLTEMGNDELLDLVALDLSRAVEA